jgi:hypothetical protein
VVSYGGAARKYLYDLDRDSIIELEVWDPDADGRFEASRPTRMPIPEFLMPARAPLNVAVAPVSDSIQADSAIAGAPPAGAQGVTPPPSMEYSPELFSSTDAGPMRFWRALQRARAGSPPDSQAARPPAVPAEPSLPVRRDTVRRDTVRRDTARIDTLRIRQPNRIR